MQVLVSPDGRWRVEVRDLQAGCALLWRSGPDAAGWAKLLSGVSLDVVVRRLHAEGVDAATLVKD